MTKGRSLLAHPTISLGRKESHIFISCTILFFFIISSLLSNESQYILFSDVCTICSILAYSCTVYFLRILRSVAKFKGNLFSIND